jgi:Flp pilus assembly protein TadG
MRADSVSADLRGEQATGLVEYAIICILFLTMILGIVDFGRALYAYHFVSNAAREATRWAAVNGSTCGNDAPPGSCTAPVSCSSGSCATCTSNCSPAAATDVENYVTMLTPTGIDSTKTTTTVSWPITSGSPGICATTQNYPGCTVEVQVSYNFSFLFPLIRTNSITLSSTSQMVIAH